ncbi:MAG: helix-turn-helix domain-containing protein [Chitinophagales bacterium]|nr:helix-turn-helix domain-containing protein [Chitinophagales bacterium]
MIKKTTISPETPQTDEKVIDIEGQIKNLGKKIRELRIKKGYTNAEFFAYDHRINRSQYGKYERGEDLRFSSLLRILQIHNMTLKEFFEEGFE